MMEMVVRARFRPGALDEEATVRKRSIRKHGSGGTA
jgi:hypothetical protein